MNLLSTKKTNLLKKKIECRRLESDSFCFRKEKIIQHLDLYLAPDRYQQVYRTGPKKDRTKEKTEKKPHSKILLATVVQCVKTG